MSQIRRRKFLFAAGALLAASLARAQQSGRLPVLGWLSASRAPTPEQISSSPITAKLKELGWIEGKTFLVERAYGEGSEDALPELAAGLVRKQIVDFTNLNRLLGISNTPDFVTLGGLLAYSSYAGLEPILRSFEYVDRILRGAKAADLAVELPSRIELAINLKTARALGLRIPQSVLVRANRVIE